MKLTDIPKYRRFINARNKTLEKIHANTQSDIAILLDEFMTKSMEIVTYSYSMVGNESFLTTRGSRIIDAINHGIESIMPRIAADMTSRIMRMKRATYLLSKAGEMEAVAQVTLTKQEERISKEELNQAGDIKSSRDENLYQRVVLALNRLKRKIIDAVETSRVMEEPLEDMQARVTSKFPKLIKYKTAQKELTRVKEADSPKQEFMVNVFADEEEWQDAISLLKKTSFPKFRFDNEQLEDVEAVTYPWEIEKEITNEFVTQVRQGEHEGAKKVGVKDFVWIAVIDDATDECCLWRDGLTTTEIEKELRGKRKSDDCDAITPPAHFNCRCSLAPVSDNVSDKPDNDLGDFETWLQN